MKQSTLILLAAITCFSVLLKNLRKPGKMPALQTMRPWLWENTSPISLIHSFWFRHQDTTITYQVKFMVDAEITDMMGRPPSESFVISAKRNLSPDLPDASFMGHQHR